MVPACSESRGSEATGLNEECQGPVQRGRGWHNAGTQVDFWGWLQVHTASRHCDPLPAKTHPKDACCTPTCAPLSSHQSLTLPWGRLMAGGGLGRRALFAHWFRIIHTPNTLLLGGYAMFIIVTSTWLCLTSTCVSRVFMKLFLLALWMFTAFMLIGWNEVKVVCGTHQSTNLTMQQTAKGQGCPVRGPSWRRWAPQFWSGLMFLMVKIWQWNPLLTSGIRVVEVPRRTRPTISLSSLRLAVSPKNLRWEVGNQGKR